MSFLAKRKVYERAGIQWLLREDQLIDLTIINREVWEPGTLERAKTLVQPGWACLDVGANIGAYTLHLAQAVGPTGRVIAVEPSAECCQLIQDQARLNGFKNIEVIHAKVDSYDGGHDDFKNSHECPYESDEPRENRIETIPTYTVDALMIELGATPDFIKVDVDGPEWHVLKGAEAHLSEHMPPALLFEVGDYTMRRHQGIPKEGYEYGTMARKLCDYVKSFGYNLFREDTGELADIEDLMKRYDLSISTINLFASTKETIQ